MDTLQPFDFEAYNRQVEAEIHDGKTVLVSPLEIVLDWYCRLDEEIRSFIANSAKYYLSVDCDYRDLAQSSEFFDDEERFMTWLCCEEADHTHALSRMFLLRGMLKFDVFACRCTPEHWDELEEFRAQCMVENKARGIDTPEPNSFVAGLPQNRAAWIEAAESWRRLCNAQLSDEALSCWWDLAMRLLPVRTPAEVAWEEM